MRRKFVKYAWCTLGCGITLALFAFVAIWNGWIGYMPDVDDLQNPISKTATQIYSSDGKILGTWSLNKDNRVVVDYQNISPYVINALVATEDERFYEHSGIDFIALSRAIIKRGIFRQKNAGGGSTITQQLAKQLYSEHASSTFARLLQKPIEWVIAVKLERNYTKEEILTLYLNYFDFLHNAVGIKNAAKVYFNKQPDELTVAESAVLVGMCKNPSYYNPVRHYERCLNRRNVVFEQMLKNDYLTEAQYDSLKNEPIHLNFHRMDHKNGPAPYFREFLRLYLSAKRPSKSDYPDWNYRQYVSDSIAWEQDPLYGWCNKNKDKDGNPYNLYQSGLKIYTTVDSRMQEYAENAVYEHVGNYLQPAFDQSNKGNRNAPFSGNLTPEQYNQLMTTAMKRSDRYIQMKRDGYSEDEIRHSFHVPQDMTVFTYNGEVDTTMTPMDSIRYYKSFLRAGMMSMDPQTGFVKAYVGGLDYSHFMYDMTTKGHRQVGSTIKPFLYSLAMENGFSPCDLAPNVQQTYMVPGSGAWTPRNGSKARYGEMVTLKWGLAQSNNWISAWLMSQLSPMQFVELLHAYGFSNPDIHPSMALCLGPCEMTVAEMVSAYSAFVNHGIRTAPVFVSRIEDANGNVLAEFSPRMNEVISAEAADKMIVLLRGVIDGGTGGRLRYRYGFTGEIAGKTGTTNANSDGWFMGCTPELITGCWVGGEDRDIHFASMSYGQGASAALPIWALYMQKVYANKMLGYSQETKFDLPAGFNPCSGSEGNEDIAIEGGEKEIIDVYE